MKLDKKTIFFTLPFLFILFINQTLANTSKEIPMQDFNQTLYNKLPASIQKNNEIIVANYGTLPPYIKYDENNNVEGVNIDFMQAISEILGVKVKHEQVATLSAVIVGVQSGKYDIGIGPFSDSLERQKNADLIAYSLSFAAFAVLKGNPSNIDSIYNVCGKVISVQSGTILEKVLHAQSEICTNKGKPAIDIKIFKDQITAMLAVKSKRVDACFSAAPTLAYYTSIDNELEFLDAKEQVPPKLHSALLPKDSPLSPVILAAFQQLFDNGTYAKIMTKWGLEKSMIPAPGINLVTE